MMGTGSWIEELQEAGMRQYSLGRSAERHPLRDLSRGSWLGARNRERLGTDL